MQRRKPFGGTGYSKILDSSSIMRLLLIATTNRLSGYSLKHVDIRQHWLREQIADNRIQIAWISASHMPADGLTKSLPKQKHQNFVQQLGLVNISKLGLLQNSSSSYSGGVCQPN